MERLWPVSDDYAPGTEADLLLRHLPVRTFLLNASGILLQTKGVKSYPLVHPETGEPRIGEYFLNRFVPAPALMQGFQRALTGEFSQAAVSFPNRHIEFYFSPVPHAHTADGIAAVHVIGIDITDKIQPQRELERFRVLAEKASEAGNLGFWETDINTEETKWSRGLYNILNVTPETYNPTVMGNMEPIHPDDRDGVRNEANKAVREGRPFSCSFRINPKYTSTPKYARMYGDMFTNEQKVIVRAFGILQDVTEAHQREEEIRGAGERMDNLLRSIPTPFFSLDSDGTIVFANRPALELMGSDSLDEVSAGSSSGLAKFSEVMPAWNAGNIGRNLRKAVDEGVPFTFEEFYAPTNAWYDIHVFPNRDAGVSVMFTSITERKRLEFTLKQLNESKNRFFSIIAHDLRSPLSSIMGLTGMALNQNRDTENGKLALALNYLDSSVKNVYKLLDNLMMWARLQMNDIRTLPSIWLLSEAVGFNIELFAPKGIEKGIIVSSDIPDAMKCFADRDMADTVLRNLISNALKFTGEGGTVHVSAREEDYQITIAISDTGMGIPAQTLPNLFRLDAKHSTPGTKGETGTGLGLKLCKDLLERNRGTIRVESTVGKGTTFWVTLPARP
ncbi:MAG: ATP-binding protein [Bacteroidota bacterium]